MSVWGIHRLTVSFSRSNLFSMGHLFDADTLLVDTGSSNTWIGASKSYEKTNTSKDTGGQFVSIRSFYPYFTIETASRVLHMVI